MPAEVLDGTSQTREYGQLYRCSSAFNIERIEESYNVMKPGFTADMRVSGNRPASSPQVGAVSAVTGRGYAWGDGAPLPPVMRKSVQ